MNLKEQIEQDLVASMKEKDEVTLSTLRMLKSALHNSEIAKKSESDEADIVKTIQGQIKSRQDSVEMYRKGGRLELVQKEEKEIEILKKYLPEQMSEEDVSAKVKEAITQTGASSIQDMGKVIGKLMGEISGKADGAMISRLVKEELSK